MVEPRRRRRGDLLPISFAALAISAGLLYVRQATFVSSVAPLAWRRMGRSALFAEARAGTEPEMKRWQRGLDTAFLDVDATPQERLEGLRELVIGAGDASSALQEAVKVVSEKGLKDGHPAALDALFPKGTLARSDLEGLAAVVRQAPEVVGDLRTSTPLGTSADTSSTRQAPDLDQVRDALGRLLSAEGLTEVADEAINALRSTPKGLEQPTFQIVLEGDGFEVRRYENFTVATRRMSAPRSKDGSAGAASAEGFNSLAAYLFGDNDDDRSMRMTMPVEIDYRDDDPDVQTMSFVMPAEDILVEGGLPKPTDPSVQIKQVPERLVAVRRFPGVATSGEVKRQSEKLLAAVQADGSYTPVADGEYSVLQYNPPYTIPWRRRNEVAVVVSAVDIPVVDAEEVEPTSGEPVEEQGDSSE